MLFLKNIKTFNFDFVSTKLCNIHEPTWNCKYSKTGSKQIRHSISCNDCHSFLTRTDFKTELIRHISEQSTKM